VFCWCNLLAVKLCNFTRGYSTFIFFDYAIISKCSLLRFTVLFPCSLTYFVFFLFHLIGHAAWSLQGLFQWLINFKCNSKCLTPLQYWFIPFRTYKPVHFCLISHVPIGVNEKKGILRNIKWSSTQKCDIKRMVGMNLGSLSTSTRPPHVIILCIQIVSLLCKPSST